MITSKNIETIFSDCSDLGYDVEYKDILYCLVCDMFEDSTLAYQTVFGGSLEDAKIKVMVYGGLGKITFLKAHLTLYLQKEKPTSNKKETTITYDENLVEFLKIRQDIKDQMAMGKIDPLGGNKALADMSVKLNDKFKINDENKGQVVVVETKYNDVCSHCQHEVARAPITKEEAMKMYNLVEK